MKQGFETLLVHTGSFLHRQTSNEKIIEGLIIRDIKCYKTILIKEVMKIESSDYFINIMALRRF